MSILMPFILLISPPCGAETVIVNKAFNGREIKVRAGGLIQVDLEALGAAGYDWAIQGLDTAHFEVLGVETRDTPAQDDVTGAPVVRTWRISTKKKGKAELKFLHYRPWEGEDKASEIFVLYVLIL